MGHSECRIGRIPKSLQRVLIVSNLFPPHVVGGAEVVAYRQAKLLQARGHQVSVFAGRVASPGQGGRLEVEEEEGLRVWRTPIISADPDDNFFVPSIAARLESVLEVEQPDIVHLHNLIGLGFSLIPLVKRHGIPAIVTLHDYSGYCYRATALRPDDNLCQDPEECGLACLGSIRPRDVGIALPMRLRRDYVSWALGHADQLISPSAALAKSYMSARAADSSRIEVISNGIDLAPFQTITRETGCRPLRFVCIAYLGEHKGIPDLLKAAARLADSPDLAGRWSLSIVGDGHLRPTVEDEIASGRFGDAVTYLGRVPRERVIAEMAAADVVVLPSRWPENEPVVLLEAIAAGVAQLATSTGGMPDLIEPGVTGELVPPSDPAALANAMANYVRDPDRARRQGEVNRARRDSFSEEASLDAVEAVYEAAAAQQPSSRCSDRPLVLCAGDWPLSEVAEICNNLHRLEESVPGIRLIWHEWAGSEAWEHAALLWNWSSRSDDAAMQSALRAGVPILAPVSSATAAAVENSFGAALTYSNFLEGMVALARVPRDTAALRRLRRNCPEAAALLSASAPRQHYHLATPAVPA